MPEPCNDAAVRRPCLLFTASTLLLLGCPKIGEKEAEGPNIVLYGHDADAPDVPPPGCKALGRVEASIVGKDRFPEKDLRAAAREEGGTGVARIRKIGNEEVFHGTKYTFRGTIVKCPRAGAAPAASAAAPP